MGAASSKLPSILLSEANAYVKGRKRAAKDLMKAHKAFATAVSEYADALRATGAAILIYCEGTSIFVTMPSGVPYNLGQMNITSGGAQAMLALPAPTSGGMTVTEMTSGDVRAGYAQPSGIAPVPLPTISYGSDDSSDDGSDAGDGERAGESSGLPSFDPPSGSTASHPLARPPGIVTAAGGAAPVAGPTPTPPLPTPPPPSSPPPQDSILPPTGGSPPVASQAGYPALPPHPAVIPPNTQPTVNYPAMPQAVDIAAAAPAASNAGPSPPPAPGWDTTSLPVTTSTASQGYTVQSGSQVHSGAQSGAMVVASGGAGQQAARVSPFVGPGGGAVVGDTKVEAFARGVNELFVDASNRLVPLLELLAMGEKLSKFATPSLTAGGAVKAGGQLESIGETLQKLVNWERFLKKEVKGMEVTRHQKKKQDKKVVKETKRVTKDPNKDPRKLQTVQSKAQYTEGKLSEVQHTVSMAVQHLEQFKTDLLFPQMLRFLPCLAVLWLAHSRIHQQQQQLTLTLPRGAPAVAADGTVIGPPYIPTTKAQYDATKKLNDAFKKWNSTLSNLLSTQRKYFTAVNHWAKKALAVPPSFPRAPPPPPNPYNPSPALLVPGDGPLVALANDWVRTVDRLADAQFKDAVAALSAWMMEAFERQGAEIKQQKRVEDCHKQLAKLESKLEVAQQKDRELQLGSGGQSAATSAAVTGDSQAAVSAASAAQKAAAAAAAEVHRCKTAVDHARNTMNAERVSLERIAADARASALSGMRDGLPIVFQNASKFAEVSSQAMVILQNQHAPWLPPPF